MAITEVTIEPTRDRLVQIVNAEPGKYSQAEIGRILGVRRQRISVLTKRLDLGDLVRKRPKNYCPGCGKSIPGDRIRCHLCFMKTKQVTLICDFCGQEFERRESKTKRSKFHFCSTSCRESFAQELWRQASKPERRPLRQAIYLPFDGS